MTIPASSSAWWATKRLVLFQGELKSSVTPCSSAVTFWSPLPSPLAGGAHPLARGPRHGHAQLDELMRGDVARLQARDAVLQEVAALDLARMAPDRGGGAASWPGSGARAGP